MKVNRKQVERLIIVHLMTGDKTFDELLAHVKGELNMQKQVHRLFEDAMMSLWINDKITEVLPRQYSRRRA